MVDSRESPLKNYKKQLIKKEYKDYIIEPKIYFKRPFYRFWFMFIEPNRNSLKEVEINKVLFSLKEEQYRLSSLVFEQLSIELLKFIYKKDDLLTDISSYWDKNSEFDIYAKTKSAKYILGECKYKNRPVTKAELIKLKQKAIYSNLIVDKFVFFSKSGFSQELYKLDSKNLELYELNDFKKLLN
jgi:AAA+ ATPase superfamily predicted ATPase